MTGEHACSAKCAECASVAEDPSDVFNTCGLLKWATYKNLGPR